MPGRLAPLIEKLPRVQATSVLAVPPARRSLFLARLAATSERAVIGVVPSERVAEDLFDDVSLFSNDVLLLPAWETLPFEHVSPNTVTMARRAHVRHRIARGDTGLVVIASVRAAVQRLSPSPVDPIEVTATNHPSFDELVSSLAEIGYERTARVETRGEFAVRGGIVDVYPADEGTAVRIEFWGDEIDRMVSFSVADQRATGEQSLALFYPAREVRVDASLAETATDLMRTEAWATATWERLAAGHTFAGMESWLPWLGEPRSFLEEATASAQVVVFDPEQARVRTDELIAEEQDLAEALAVTWEGGDATGGKHPALYLEMLDLTNPPGALMVAPPAPRSPEETALPIRMLDATPGDANSVMRGIERLLNTDVTTIVALDGVPAAERVRAALAEEGLALPLVETVDGLQSAVISEGIHAGFVAPDVGLAVLGEEQIAGRHRSHRRPGGTRGSTATGYADLREGDYVVHHRHGIGRFEGLTVRTIADIERDYLVVAYAGEDRLYVPTDQLAAVRKYTGGEHPRLSRMGGSDWAATRTRVRKAVAVVAEQVVDLHRRRAAAAGHRFGPDTPWQRELDASFPFEETPDQLTAIGDVRDDMESNRPMDRLIFGDVGYGKTEIGVRATFKAVAEGKQVAILVPTTLLAQQHQQTFSERMAPFPVRVEMLSRFLSAAQQRAVVKAVATGEVDVVIATHRLLSEDIAFKDLGLLVIDEEQRFGVNAKDQLKRLRAGVDVLTLTATPIPRTLEMALTGIRDVSHIRTPPEDRHPILTYVGPHDSRSVSAAIRRELLREGQVFYVHNRVQSIDRAVARLQELVPEARYAIAHGQMSEGQLEQVMLDFWSGEYDVLVATTIIESGLDLPQVNTLIVERADLLGLAQLYQLRGRVGRSSQRAYAYLFHPEGQRLSEEAYRRLEAIGEATDLGSGFRLAMRDLEIRGAGSMLGEVQSGHIAAVGFDLYAQLVAEAVDELRGQETVESQPSEVRIDLPVDAHLPESYVSDQDARIEAYRRLASATTTDQIDDVRAEWKDRFGNLPEEATKLLAVAHLRVEALRAGLTDIVALRSEVKLAPVDLAASQEVRLARLAPRAVLKASTGELFLPRPPGPGTEVLESVIEFVRKMWPEP